MSTVAVINLVSDDGTIFPTEVDVVNQSGFLREMLEEFESSLPEQIEMECDSITLEKMIEYMTHLKKNPSKPIEKNGLRKELTEYDQKFLDIDVKDMFTLLLASNKYNVDALMHTISMTIAGMIKGKTPDEIRKTFSV